MLNYNVPTVMIVHRQKLALTINVLIHVLWRMFAVNLQTAFLLITSDSALASQVTLVIHVWAVSRYNIVAMTHNAQLELVVTMAFARVNILSIS